ncbi:MULTISPECIES: DUF6887 family protein [unclassified Nostoc]|uniref:DUF6887 family protein n=1 Tax=unclassified Nostoc TaxID=2593658 RepID=UPI002635630B|nr:hypothetical protein [Nostoc sp. S13]MDF5735748.1 hypothetical protein [Nostoc sp. S13]
MMQNLNQMTNTELKRYLSEHRNEEEAFRAALKKLVTIVAHWCEILETVNRGGTEWNNITSQRL